MEKIPPTFKQSSFEGGLVDGLNESIRPASSVGFAMNFDFDDEIGSASTRPGTFIVGGQMVAGKDILGLHNHVEGSTSRLFSVLNDTDDATAVIYNDAGSVVQTGLTADTKMRALTFNGATLMVNGVDAERSYTESGGFITTGGAFDLANMPGNTNLLTRFLSRVYASGDPANPTRVYYSGVSDGSSVSWTVGNGYVDIESDNDKGPITAFGRVPGYVLFFKTRSMTRWNYSSAFPEEMISYGAPSQECVVSSAGICAFYSNSNEQDKGFFITNGGAPQPISHDNSRPIKRIVQAIATSYESKIAGRALNNGFAWFVGDITLDGITYKNVELRYNRILNQWSMRTYPTAFKVYSSFLDANGRNVTVAGDDDGEVIEIDRPDRFVDYVSVNGEPGEAGIQFDIRTHTNKHGYNQAKTISGNIIFDTRFGQGATAYVRVNGKEDDKSCTASIKRNIADLKLDKNLKGNYFEYGIRGIVQGKKLVLKEIEVPSIEVTPSYD